MLLDFCSVQGRQAVLGLRNDDCTDCAKPGELANKITRECHHCALTGETPGDRTSEGGRRGTHAGLSGQNPERGHLVSPNFLTPFCILAVLPPPHMAYNAKRLVTHRAELSEEAEPLAPERRAAQGQISWHAGHPPITGYRGPWSAGRCSGHSRVGGRRGLKAYRSVPASSLTAWKPLAHQ